MPPILVAYLIVAVLVAVVGPALGRRVFLVAGVAPLTALVWAASQTTAVLDGERPSAELAWVPALGLDLDLRLTPMGLLMTWLIAGIGVLVMAYATAYFEDRPGLGRFAATLTVFGGAMCGLVWSDSLLGLFVFWELTSICSYLLIGFDDRSETARNSALQALLITGGGGLALLGGIVVLATEADTWSLSGLVAARPTGSVVTAGVVLVLIGAFTKSAQVPFHGWLPGAMAAPTPVSAYLHSATMVKAGVYLVAVLAPGLAHVGVWRPLTVGVGVATMVWGGYQSLRRDDLKLILAYGTIGALGAMIALFGLASPKATFAAVGVLLAHAVYKAALFMVVGIVDHAAHSRDIHRLRGLRSVMPATAATAALAGASMAALPATIGFVTKEAALEGLLKAHLTTASVLLVGLLVFSALTAAAVWRFWQGAFADGPAPPASEAATLEPIDPATVHAPTMAFVAPAGLLAVLGIVLGLAPGLVDPMVEAVAASLDPAAGAYELHAFAGFNTAFALSVLALCGAGLLIWAQLPVARLQATLSAGPTAGQAFRTAVAGVLRGANLVAGFVQHGSLPIYLATILLTVVVVPGAALVGLVGLPDGWVWADSPLQAVAALAVVVMAVGVARARRRFAAALLLGSVGYVVATLFIAYDAPDLALTQFLVETVAVVAFVLVLRQLPERFDAVPWLGRQALRIGVSVAVGLLVFGFLLATGGEGPPPPTDELMAEAAPEGGGTNVVNVILTDIRALDTLGEGTVVAVAALGVLSLTALLRGRTRGAPSLAQQERLPTGGDERSPVLDTAVQAMLPLVFALSLFLLMAGHNAPGGGFIGGLVAAAGLVLRTVARPDVPPYRWERFEGRVGIGMLLTAGMAMSGWVGGDQVLDLHPYTVEVPVLGKVKATGALPFDIGVYLIVVGLMVAILHGLSRGHLPGPLDGTTDGDGPPLAPAAAAATGTATTATATATTGTPGEPTGAGATSEARP